MKRKILALFVLVAVTMSSCYKDEVEELQTRLDALDEDLGRNTPLAITFNTTHDNGSAISHDIVYNFKGGPTDTQYIWPENDGWFQVYVERFSDVDWDEGAWIYFEYNPETDEIRDERAGFYFYNQYWDWMNRTFDPDYDGMTFTLTINNINVETGLVDVSATGSSTAESTYNEYAGKAMDATWEFRGVLPVMINE